MKLMKHMKIVLALILASVAFIGESNSFGLTDALDTAGNNIQIEGYVH